jgi:hypothetical protein
MIGHQLFDLSQVLADHRIAPLGLVRRRRDPRELAHRREGERTAHERRVELRQRAQRPCDT